MTSNLGASYKSSVSLGFSIEKGNRTKYSEEVMSSLKERFAPEFLNRIDDIVIFNPLSVEDIKKISRNMLSELSKRAKDVGITLDFENSVTATKCARQYCIDNPENFSTVTHNKNSWGLTACDTPSGYSGLLGSNPTGFGHNDQTRNDGTVALCGSVGSIPFLPEEVQESIEYYYTFDNRVLVGEFGLLDAYNNENNLWVANDVIGIDKGISVVMIENYRTGLIWDCLFDSNFMNRAIEVLEYEKTN